MGFLDLRELVFLRGCGFLRGLDFRRGCGFLRGPVFLSAGVGFLESLLFSVGVVY